MADTGPLRLPDSPDSAFDDKVYGWLALVMVFGFFGFIAATFWVSPKLPGDTVGVIIGWVGGWISAIVSFKWGSSIGSRDKDLTIQKLTNGKP